MYVCVAFVSAWYIQHPELCVTIERGDFEKD